jgi:FkbM family methyltransferase
MNRVGWALSVFASRWRNRFSYVKRAPFVYRNWWAVPLPKIGISVVLELRNGLRYLVRAGTTDLSVVNEVSLSNEYLDFVGTLPEDADVMDVGANIGDFSMQLARACPRGRVFAVEPIRENVRMVEIQKQLNHAEHVTSLHLALGGHEGEIDIHSAGSQSSAFWGDGASERVRVTTLPRLMEELKLEELALLKLDCEGAEWSILPAAEATLGRVQRIVMEFHCQGDWTPEKLAAWLRDRGFDVRHTPGPWNGLLWARRTRTS